MTNIKKKVKEMSIKRYDISNRYCEEGEMEEDKEGNYIEHSDHLKALAEKDKEIARYREALETIKAILNRKDEVIKFAVNQALTVISITLAEGENLKDETTMKIAFLEWSRHYAEALEEREGRPATLEDTARNWNGGPIGYSKDSTKEYWFKLSSYSQIPENPA